MVMPLTVCLSTSTQYEDESIKYLNEACRILGLQAGMMENLSESMVLACQGRNIFYITIFLFNYSAFNTTQQVLDQLFTIAISSMVRTWLDQVQDFWDPLHFPCFKLKLAYVHKDNSSNEHMALTLHANVTHFDSVVNCIITLCLRDPSMMAQDRARVMEFWIQVAK
ncbi:hypothetical protein HPG69_014729, partial [Diceros bicornis minor]